LQNSSYFPLDCVFRYQRFHNRNTSLLRYSVFYANRDESEVFVATARAARNMSFQGMTAEDGKVHYVDGLQSVKGKELLGAALKGPLTSYEKIYALPMLTVKDDKAVLLAVFFSGTRN
uniref:Uncharacterized protein n=1 Tax=Parascaris equorum TaxID=6256 RepID=A0A914RC43_PAREQ